MGFLSKLAAQNHPEAYMKALGPKKDWFANLAMTIDRNGNKFAPFFVQLFESMFKGQSRHTPCRTAALKGLCPAGSRSSR